MDAAFYRFWQKYMPAIFRKLEGGPMTDAGIRHDVHYWMHELFNNRPNLTYEEEQKYPEVAASISNFGVRDASGWSNGPDDYADHLASAIRVFEPRLHPKTLTVRFVQPPDNKPQARWIFRIDAEIWSSVGWTTFRCLASFDLMEGRAAVAV